MNQALRAFLGCSDICVRTVAEKWEQQNGRELTLDIHYDEEDAEAIVSGPKQDIMYLIGAFAQAGEICLNEVWTYEY